MRQVRLNPGKLVPFSRFGALNWTVRPLLVAQGLGLGWVLGGPSIDTRRASALGTGHRNIAAALAVASESFSDPSMLIMVIVVTIVGLLTLMANYGLKSTK